MQKLLLYFFLLNFALLECKPFQLKAYSSIKSHNDVSSNCQAVVLGKIIKKSVLKSGNTYITEYKLKTKNWLFKKPEIKKTKFVTLKILGAELPERGLVIKASTSPDHIPFKKDAIFILKRNKLKQSNVFTLSRDGVIYPKNIDLTDEEIEILFDNTEDI